MIIENLKYEFEEFFVCWLVLLVFVCLFFAGLCFLSVCVVVCCFFSNTCPREAAELLSKLCKLISCYPSKITSNLLIYNWSYEKKKEKKSTEIHFKLIQNVNSSSIILLKG